MELWKAELPQGCWRSGLYEDRGRTCRGQDICELVLLNQETLVISAVVAMSDPGALFHLCSQVSR